CDLVEHLHLQRKPDGKICQPEQKTTGSRNGTLRGSGLAVKVDLVPDQKFAHFYFEVLRFLWGSYFRTKDYRPRHLFDRFRYGPMNLFRDYPIHTILNAFRQTVEQRRT